MSYYNISKLITHNAKVRGEKKFLYFNDIIYTYKQAEEQVIRTAQVLRDNGVKAGDRVVIFLGNSPEYIFSYFAITMLGAIAVPTNNFLKERELSSNMNDCAAEYVISSPVYEPVVKHTMRLVPSLKKIFSFEDLTCDSININKHEIKDKSPIISDSKQDDVAVLIYTSGTTGKAKGVMLTHYNLMENAKSTVLAFQSRVDDIFTVLLPMFHSYSFMACVMMPLLTGSSMVVLESIMDTGKQSYKDMLEELKPTILCGVPQLYSAMARRKVMDNMPYRMYVSGGAPLPLETIKAFKETYGVDIIEGYGLSEASPVAIFNLLDKQKPGTVGVAVPSVDVKIVDEQGNIVPVGTPGELCVRGPNIMKGYWNQPEETAKVLKADGWLHTGDVAVMDEDSFVSIVDRIKDLILVKGMNVYPREVEEILHTHPSVIIAAVIGIPAEDGSEVIIAYIKADPEKPVTPAALKDFAKKNLANFKVPKSFILVDDIPINSNGKVMKKELREMAKRGQI